MTTPSLSQSPAWQALAAHKNTTDDSIRQITAAGLTLDLSRHGFDDKTLALLVNLATQEDVVVWRDKLFAGAAVNTSEDRAAEHWRLRAADAPPLNVPTDGIDAIIHLGIGGSALGPQLLMDCLGDKAKVKVRFAVNTDPTDFARASAGLDPKHTLVIVASKSFGTAEVMANLERAKAWLQAGGAPLAKHMLAITSNIAKAAVYGIPADRCLSFPDTIGGRYSVWGPVSTSIRLALGDAVFNAFLAGARAIDSHFKTAPLHGNAPVMLALASLWHINVGGARAEAVLPYATRLARLPAYLQQLVMESNGKSVTRDGEAIDYATAPVVFGEAGTIGQHSFYQLLHQGTHTIPADIILVADGDKELLANGIGQAQALQRGTPAGTAPHRQCQGGKPSTVITLPTLDAYHAGALIALYELKTFTQAILWRINPFDQWGVEIGKELANTIRPLLESGAATAPDTLTAATIATVKRP